jgi:hypothetical protein
MKNIGLGAFVTAAAILAATPVLAEETQAKIDNDKKADSVAAQETDLTLSDTASGMRAVRDKKTGELRAPNPAELRKLEEAEGAARSAQTARGSAPSQTEITHHANGMVSVKLGPEYLVSLEGVRKDDGTIERSHATDDEKQPIANDELPTE